MPPSGSAEDTDNGERELWKSWDSVFCCAAAITD